MRLSGGAAAASAAAAGAFGWLLVAAVDGRREAWDSAWYFTLFLPAMALLVGALAFAAPERPARVAFALAGGQAVVAVLQNPDGGLLPLGLILFAVFGAFLTVPAIVGARLRRKVDGPTHRHSASRGQG
jgi:hypothetical protein